MNIDLYLRMCHDVFAEKPWFLLEHGTVFVASSFEVSSRTVLETMKALDALIGPHGGEGTPFGDCTPLKLKAHDAWIVEFAIPIRTFIGADELEEIAQFQESSTEVMRRDGTYATQEQELRIALFGRHKRNLDVRAPKIIASLKEIA